MSKRKWSFQELEKLYEGTISRLRNLLTMKEIKLRRLEGEIKQLKQVLRAIVRKKKLGPIVLKIKCPNCEKFFIHEFLTKHGKFIPFAFCPECDKAIISAYKRFFEKYG